MSTDIQAPTPPSDVAPPVPHSAAVTHVAPPLTPAQAAAYFSVPSPKTGNKSVYVLFKALLTKQAKGNRELAPTAAAAKEAFNKVKSIPTTDTYLQDKENPNHALILLKHEAQQEYEVQQAAAIAAMKEWCQEFDVAAVVHLRGLVHGECSLVAMTFGGILKMAESKLKLLQALNEVHGLVCHLRNGTEEQLQSHANEQLALKRELALLRPLQDFQQAQAEKNASIAEGLKDEICAHMKKQMKYDGKLKFGYQTETYRRGGVTPEMFEYAFGTTYKSTTISGSDVGYKSLRYGAYLQYKEIAVKLQGTDLVATGKYTMSK
jgi:hypothetical protein